MTHGNARRMWLKLLRRQAAQRRCSRRPASSIASAPFLIGREPHRAERSRMSTADDALGDLDDGSFAAASRDAAGDLTAVVDRHLGPEWAWSRTHGADHHGDRDAIAPIRPTRDVVQRVVHR